MLIHISLRIDELVNTKHCAIFVFFFWIDWKRNFHKYFEYEYNFFLILFWKKTLHWLSLGKYLISFRNNERVSFLCWFHSIWRIRTNFQFECNALSAFIFFYGEFSFCTYLRVNWGKVWRLTNTWGIGVSVRFYLVIFLPRLICNSKVVFAHQTSCLYPTSRLILFNGKFNLNFNYYLLCIVMLTPYMVQNEFCFLWILHSYMDL